VAVRFTLNPDTEILPFAGLELMPISRPVKVNQTSYRHKREFRAVGTTEDLLEGQV